LNESKSKLPESFPILLALGGVYFAVQLITGGNYNIFRDEYYYIDCAKHLAFGYVDEPPFSIFILALWKAVFGDSQLSIRIIPALLGSVLVVMGGVIAASMGGNKTAQVFSALAVLCAPAYLGMGSIYSMNSFDVVFWAILFYVLIKIINTENEKLWLWFGIIAGFGLMNKISVGYLGAGIIT
jgi:4-amino-4-deoxy-L-arabinose transferase-like glycosyltransferase